MKLYLVRHGETLSKSQKLNRYNTGLSEKGKEQSKKVGIFFKNKNFDVVYCSELERAIQTLEQIRPFIKDTKIVFTKELNEINKGIHNTREEYEESLKKSGLKDHQFRPDKGENYFDVEKRAKKFLKFLKEKHPDDTILIIGHGIFLRLFILQLFNKPMEEMTKITLENCSISYFEEYKKGFIEQKVNRDEKE